VLLKAGQTAEARAYLLAGRTIMAALVEKYSDRAQWKQDLAWFDEQLAALDQ
jgi:hypothetical protein